MFQNHVGVNLWTMKHHERWFGSAACQPLGLSKLPRNQLPSEAVQKEAVLDTIFPQNPAVDDRAQLMNPNWLWVSSPLGFPIINDCFPMFSLSNCWLLEAINRDLSVSQLSHLVVQIFPKCQVMGHRGRRLRSCLMSLGAGSALDAVGRLRVGGSYRLVSVEVYQQ